VPNYEDFPAENFYPLPVVVKAGECFVFPYTALSQPQQAAHLNACNRNCTSVVVGAFCSDAPQWTQFAISWGEPLPSYRSNRKIQSPLTSSSQIDTASNDKSTTADVSASNKSYNASFVFDSVSLPIGHEQKVQVTCFPYKGSKVTMFLVISTPAVVEIDTVFEVIARLRIECCPATDYINMALSGLALGILEHTTTDGFSAADAGIIASMSQHQDKDHNCNSISSPNSVLYTCLDAVEPLTR
jgi:hypothetical protein